MEDKKDEKDQSKNESINKGKKEILKYKEFQVDYLRIFRENYDNNRNINSNNPVDITDMLKQCLNIPIVTRVKNACGGECYSVYKNKYKSTNFFICNYHSFYT